MFGVPSSSCGTDGVRRPEACCAPSDFILREVRVDQASLHYESIVRGSPRSGRCGVTVADSGPSFMSRKTGERDTVEARLGDSGSIGV